MILKVLITNTIIVKTAKKVGGVFFIL